MKVPVSKQVQIDERRREIVRLRVQGLTVKVIAQRLGVDQKTVFRDLGAVHEQWKQSNATDITALKAEQLTKLQAVESEAWAAWHASKSPKKRNSLKKTDRGTGSPESELVVETQDREGDPQWLEVVMKCHDRVAKLFGLEPKAEEIAAATGPPVMLFLPDNGRDPLPPGQTYVLPPSHVTVTPAATADAPSERGDDQPATEAAALPPESG